MTTASERNPIIIVGSGLAGYSLVRELRKHNADAPILLVTADDGTSYSKPMLSTGFGKGKDADGLAQADHQSMADQFNLRLLPHTRVTALNPQAHQIQLGSLLDSHSESQWQSYSKLVLAWGAEVIPLHLAGSGSNAVYSINDLDDYRAFRAALMGAERVAIMGAGLIGCEFANDLRLGGYQVEVIAPSATVMPTLMPEQAARALQNELEVLGVIFHLGTQVDRIEQVPAGTDGGVTLALANGRQLQADVVISAVGLRPRTELAQQAGLAVNRGIVVNRALETSAPDVYALGDCAEVDGQLLLYVMPLMASARALAKTLSGELSEVLYPSMPVMIKTPCCPAAVNPPPAGAKGKWQVEQDGNHVKALFNSADGALLGFALTGRFAMEKQALSRQLPALHSAVS
ncbi:MULTISPECIES: FAD-dependent oxidoreductase [unclassified Marinobacter]|uniref:FAD-dependent oxidoreductase n=1 Tax=unclassified Marinobacter TaxID=83889 RepID=UPI00200FACE5|nr:MULTISPECIES: FAD-dependent oxidoreductase [unclassified Marinobacter]UQG55696.1 FAD-dependent oxidoreductase [Marinobacter sp. M4C]UQG64500.1 FAD-dependent oxidoreductase [Marinobacter sp. M2C]UQG68779.1 FAD-dependent oxidoreductase [Marinobacter sp. M1C]